jgi:hypothetical protein
MIQLIETTDDTALLRLTAEELYLLHGALRDGMNDIADPTSLSDRPTEVGALLFALGDVLSWMADPPEEPSRRGRRRRRPKSWYWAQWIQPRALPERLVEATLDVSLSERELEILRRVTPLALAAVGPAEWVTRVGCSPERSAQIHAELLAAGGRADGEPEGELGGGPGR